ncbi:MAG: hypothetical protein JXR31_01370 [Prolixibacteraceae bacterium]|nr:hypothetical protein [Prolixibacteraceae bacterium]
MKYIVSILMICCSLGFSYAQNCKDNFIENVEQTYNKSKSKFGRIISKSENKSSQFKSVNFDNLTTIYIPIIVSKKAKGIKVNKENFLCNLNVKEMEFNEAAIIKDSVVFGIVTQCPEDCCKYKFVNNSPYIDLFVKPLVEKLIEIRPCIIFSIYNITDAYWFIKDSELKVLVFETNESNSTDLKIYKAEEYIYSLSEEQINSFLYLKRVKVISY